MSVKKKDLCNWMCCILLLGSPSECQHVLAGHCCSHFLTAHLGLVPAEALLRYPGGGAVSCTHHTCPRFLAYGDLCFSVFPWWNVCFQGSQQPACADKLNWGLSREALSRSAAGCVTAQRRVSSKHHWLWLSLLALEIPLEVCSLSSHLISFSNISLLIEMRTQDIVLMCNSSGLVAEQKSPKGRIHNPLKAEENQRLWKVTFCGVRNIPRAKLWCLCDQFLSHFHISSHSSRKYIKVNPARVLTPVKLPLPQVWLPAKRQLCVYGLIILCDRVMKYLTV